MTFRNEVSKLLVDLGASPSLIGTPRSRYRKVRLCATWGSAFEVGPTKRRGATGPFCVDDVGVSPARSFYFPDLRAAVIWALYQTAEQQKERLRVAEEAVIKARANIVMTGSLSHVADLGSMHLTAQELGKLPWPRLLGKDGEARKPSEFEPLPNFYRVMTEDGLYERTDLEYRYRKVKDPGVGA